MSYRGEESGPHRINDPAFITDSGSYAWWYNGKLHRYYGPARLLSGFNSYSYWIFGEKIE